MLVLPLAAAVVSGHSGLWGLEAAAFIHRPRFGEKLALADVSHVLDIDGLGMGFALGPIGDG
jgi:hypothetical protein